MIFQEKFEDSDLNSFEMREKINLLINKFRTEDKSKRCKLEIDEFGVEILTIEDDSCVSLNID